MTAPSPLADCCPSCLPPFDRPDPVLPLKVTDDGGSLRASYRHDVCGAEWDCWWSAEAAGWPLKREEGAA